MTSQTTQQTPEEPLDSLPFPYSQRPYCPYEPFEKRIKNIRVLVVNNLITYSAKYGIHGYGGGGLMSTNLVRNNLAYGNSGGDFLPSTASSGDIVFQLGQNTTGRMPLFVSPRRLDFRLQRRSPAINRADERYSPRFDFAGRRRTGPPDLGALEWGTKKAR